jgi:hypothetical protein
MSRKRNGNLDGIVVDGEVYLFNKVKEGRPCKSCDLSWVCDNCPDWMEQVCGARGDGMNFKKSGRGSRNIAQ